MDAEYLIQGNFADQPDMLRLQYEWHAAIGNPRAEPPHDPRADSSDAIFAQATLWRFLEALRAWGAVSLGTTHASTPRLQACPPGRVPFARPGSAVAGWRYVYHLGRRSEEQLQILLRGDSSARLTLSKGTPVRLGPNYLLAVPPSREYAIVGFGSRPSATHPADWVVVLEGLLW